MSEHQGITIQLLSLNMLSHFLLQPLLKVRKYIYLKDSREIAILNEK